MIESREIDSAQYYGVTTANGMIGIASALEPFRTGPILINGAYEAIGSGDISALVNSFHFLDVAFAIDGERIGRIDQLRQFRQQLDMKRAVLSTSFDYADRATVRYELRALRQLPHNALLSVTVTAKRPIVITATSLLSAPTQRALHEDRPQLLTDIKTYQTVVNAYGRPEHQRQLRAASAKSQFGRHTVAAAHAWVFDEPLQEAPLVTSTEEGLTFAKPLAAGTSYHFALVGSAFTSAHAADPLNESRRLTIFAAIQGTQRLVAQHERAWHELWKSDIAIDGDEEVQRDVHSMLYHLYSSIREGTGYSIAPMGLSRSTLGYSGHIFWDAETWMFPTLLVLQPQLARAMLDYRYERLPAARRRAAARGFRGAMFPWESAASGDDDTPTTGVGGELEHHVSATVALAAWDYYRVAQDRQWLRERGYPLIKEIADFWSSRVMRNGPGRFDIANVTAVDEYADNVDNDAFTNAAAKASLAAATAAANVLGVSPNPDWEHVRQNIPILKFPNGVTREHATYGGELVKQADVNLLAYPLAEITDPAAIRRDLEYYRPRIDEATGPAMTKSVLAILYERLGEPQEAYRVFRKGYEPSKRAPFGVLAEHARGDNPYFVTAAGGSLQTLLYGFGGLVITDGGLEQRAALLPSAWRSLTLTGIGPQKHQYEVVRGGVRESTATGR
jgi:trehalose/maltose hydrolase-like predicted phosphorylase